MAVTSLPFQNSGFGNNLPNAAAAYCNFVNKSGQYWNGSAFENYSAGNYSTYDVAASHIGAGFFLVAVPALPASDDPYYMIPKARSGAAGTEAVTDAELAGPVDFVWDGSAVVSAGLMGLADSLLGRSVSTCEATAAEHSLATLILAALESSIAGTTWTIKRTDGSTTHATKTVATDSSVGAVTGVS